MSDLVNAIKELASPQKPQPTEKSRPVGNAGVSSSLNGDDQESGKSQFLKDWFNETEILRKTRRGVATDFDKLCGIHNFEPLRRTKKRRTTTVLEDGAPIKKLTERVIEMEKEDAARMKELESCGRPITRRMRRGPAVIEKVVDSESDISDSEIEESDFESSDEDLGYKPNNKNSSPKRRNHIKKEDTPKTTGNAKLENDDEDDINKTNFVFLNESLSLSPKKYGYKRPNFRKKKNCEKRQFVLQSDAFQSPKKQREGVLLLSKTPSPSKKGLVSKLELSLTKTPSSGRLGSPRKLGRMELQDQSARKRANRTLYSRLLEDGINDDDDDDPNDEDYTANIRVAEQIILDSRHGKSSSVKSTPFNTPRKQLKPFDLPTHDPNFVPTPLPTEKVDQEFFDGKYNDKALFLDGTEGYFEQHAIHVRPSHSSMVQAPHLDYDEFNSFVLISGFLHHQQKQNLLQKYKQLYHQCLFELKQGFNLVFYGIGSKRTLLLDFVQSYLLNQIDVPVVVVNGYNPAVRFREVLHQILTVLEIDKKIPKRNSECVDYLIEFYKNKPEIPKLVLLVHNIDGESFRDEKIQDYISRLATIQQFHLVTSLDHINAPLLWDSARLSKLNFVWHNVTTYQDYTTEISFRDPLMLGQTQKSAGSQGAKYVLSSLTHSSKSLYRVLATNQLNIMQEQLVSKHVSQSATALKGHIKFGLEFPTFFRLCVEEFITSNEVNFRTMLMEFVEHKMAVLARDPSGTEIAYIPYTYDELSQLVVEELTE